MKVKKIVTIEKEDFVCLVKAANILESLSSDSLCWTANRIREFAIERNLDNVDERYIEVEWDFEQ